MSLQLQYCCLAVFTWEMLLDARSHGNEVGLLLTRVKGRRDCSTESASHEQLNAYTSQTQAESITHNTFQWTKRQQDRAGETGAKYTCSTAQSPVTCLTAVSGGSNLFASHA